MLLNDAESAAIVDPISKRLMTEQDVIAVTNLHVSHSRSRRQCRRCDDFLRARGGIVYENHVFCEHPIFQTLTSRVALVLRRPRAEKARR